MDTVNASAQPLGHPQDDRYIKKGPHGAPLPRRLTLCPHSPTGAHLTLPTIDTADLDRTMSTALTETPSHRVDEYKPKATHDENVGIPGEVAPFVHNPELERRYVPSSCYKCYPRYASGLRLIM
jgi:hypothetical protein